MIKIGSENIAIFNGGRCLDRRPPRNFAYKAYLESLEYRAQNCAVRLAGILIVREMRASKDRHPYPRSLPLAHPQHHSSGYK